MLLENNLKSCAKIRRKAYNVDNPVQAKRSSGQKKPLPHRNYVVVQPATGLIGLELCLTPSCTSLARGYQHVRPSVFLDTHDCISIPLGMAHSVEN